MVPAPRADDGLLAGGQALQWVHALTSGVDTLLASSKLSAETVITSSKGIHGPQMAEYALLFMMALARRVPRLLANQADRKWERWPQPLLYGRHVVTVGTGSVARALAFRCRCMGMRVTGVSVNPRSMDDFDAVRARGELPDALRQADFVVVLVALDDGSRGLFDAGMLAAIPKHAYLVNLSRGGVLDEEALRAALRDGRLAGAAIDVFATEPLPAVDPLWDVPGLIVTPHIGGYSDIYAEQALGPLLANASAMTSGRLDRLINRVR